MQFSICCYSRKPLWISPHHDTIVVAALQPQSSC